MTRERIIHSMCGTWNHSYGLMEESEKQALFRSMAQIFDNDIFKELMTQDEVDRYEEELEKMQEQIDSLKSKLTIAIEFIQSVRNDTPKSVEWNELDKTLEAIK